MMPPDLGTTLFTGALGLVGIGVLGIVLCTHLVRIVLCIVLLETGANLLLVLAGYRAGAVAPVLVDGAATASMVDPVPQALVLTAIVIGVAVQAFMMTLLLRLQGQYGTLDIRELRRCMERDVARAAGLPLPGSDDAPRPVVEEPVPVRGGES